MEGFYTKSLEVDDLEKQILRFSLCAYAGEKFDMTPGGGRDYLTGILMLVSKEYETTSHAVHTLSFEPLQSSTVDSIMSLIARGGRAKYRFTKDGEGCRFWIATLISDLEKEGLVPEGSANVARPT
jgi:hypothetical protein